MVIDRETEINLCSYIVTYIVNKFVLVPFTFQIVAHQDQSYSYNRDFVSSGY